MKTTTTHEILDESDGSGNMTNEYVFLGGKRTAMDTITGSGGGSIGTTYYYAEDFLGSSRAMVQAGATTPCFDGDFLPFGREKDAVTTCTQNDYKFEGKERDAETGNDDFGARYYSSNFGRWLSPDWSSTPAPVPFANLTNPQTLNLYAMVQDNPESFSDLDGHVNSPQTASQTVTCDVTDTQGCNYYQVGWISVIVRSPSEPGTHDITALANKINLWSLPAWPYALTFSPNIAVAQCLKDIAACQHPTLWDRFKAWFYNDQLSAAARGILSKGDSPHLMPTLGGLVRTPIKGGPPNGRVFYPDTKGGGTLRHFDANGNAVKDVDFGPGHSGTGDPHVHDWNGDKRSDDRAPAPGEPIYTTPLPDMPLPGPIYTPEMVVPFPEPVFVF